MSDLETLTNNFIKGNRPIVFTKECGYEFVGYFLEDDTATDLYNYVERFYAHVTTPIHLYLDGEPVEKDSTLIAKLVRTSKPIYPPPERVVYRFTATF